MSKRQSSSTPLGADDGAGRPKRESANSIMMVGPDAIITNASRGQRRTIEGQTTFLNPMSESVESNTSPLCVPFVRWRLVNCHAGRLLYSPESYFISAGDYPLARMLVFDAYGSGGVALTDQAFLAMFSCIAFGADNRSSNPFFAVWHAKKHVDERGMHTMPESVRKYVWLHPNDTPVQERVFDDFLPTLHSKVPRTSCTGCWSNLHRGQIELAVVPIALYMYGRPMCEGCFTMNCVGYSAKMTAMLTDIAPWSLTDTHARIKSCFHPRLRAMLKDLRKVHIVAATDKLAAPETFDTSYSLNVHGTLVATLFYCFPQVYAVRQHCSTVNTRQPMVAFGKHSLMSNGAFHNVFVDFIALLATAAQAHAFDLANYGRFEAAVRIPEAATPAHMLPCCTLQEAEDVGLYPHHVLLSNDATTWYSAEFARVVRALMTCSLQLNLLLNPPLPASELLPAQKWKRNSVRCTPVGKLDKRVPDQAYLKLAGCTVTFYDGEYLTPGWVANILDVYQLAANTHKVELPPKVVLNISGSYYRAACGVEVNTPEAMNVGGFFRDLVELAALKGGVFPAGVLTVAQHPSVCDSINYTELEAKDTVMAIVRTELAAIKDPVVPKDKPHLVFSSLATFCNASGITVPAERDLRQGASFTSDVAKSMIVLQPKLDEQHQLGVDRRLSKWLAYGQRAGAHGPTCDISQPSKTRKAKAKSK